jgi:ACS family tartrate transporter-like MFS transporter
MALLLAGWFVAYIDRFNVAFAALQMNRDLGLSAVQFGFGAGLFFLTYSAIEIPSNLLLTRLGPRLWLGRIMITWGVITVFTVWVTGPSSFYASRLALGAAEAGFFPGIAFYLSNTLPLRERAHAFAAFAFVTQAAALAGGPIAGLLLALNGVAGKAGWQWLFAIEGLPAVALGIAIMCCLVDQPVESSGSREGNDDVSVLDSITLTIREPRYWGWATVFFAYNVGSSALRLWQPTMLRGMSSAGDSTIAVLSAIPAAVAAIAILATGYSSRLTGDRRWHIVAPLAIGAVGLFMVSSATSTVACIVAASLASTAVACQPPLFASVTALADGRNRAAAVAFVNSVSMIGSFVGPTLVGYLRDATGSFEVAYVVLAAGVAAGAVLAVGVRETAARSVQTIERQLA